MDYFQHAFLFGLRILTISQLFLLSTYALATALLTKATRAEFKILLSMEWKLIFI